MLMSKHVLGLDLGVGSIGWCLIALDAQGDPAEILGMGSRVVPLNNATDAADFSIGKAFTANQKRTARRTMRRGFARYQLRRYRLRRELEKVGMLPDAALIQLPLLELWELRERAATAGRRLTLPELGRVLCHINQKRGYRHAKSDAAAIVGDEGEKKKDSNSAYLAGIRANDEKLQDEHKTVGQYFAEQLRQNQSESPTGGISYRIKDQIFSRQRYIDEYDQIMEAQRVHYPDILTDEFIRMLRDEVIFMQRPLKSCKHLVSLCEFEKQERVMRIQQDDGKGGRQLVERRVKFGPKVAPKSSPLFQLCRIYEAVNNIRLTRPDGSPRDITPEERAKIVAHLQSSASLSFAALKKLLKEKALIADQLTTKSGLKGNSTRVALASALQPYPQYHHLLDMELETRMMSVQLTDEETGEVTEREVAVVTDSYVRQPLYLDAAEKQEVRSVRCYVDKPSVAKAIPIRFDECGRAITFVKSGSNHHLAIYRTPKGELVESIVSFWDAVNRARYGLPLIIKYPRKAMEQVIQRDDIPESVLRLLPPADYEFVEVFQQNEMAVVGLPEEEFRRAVDTQDYRTLSEHLYRLKGISSKDYEFHYHLDTDDPDETDSSKKKKKRVRNTSGRIPRIYRIRGIGPLQKKNVRKVRVDLLGRISLL